MISPIKARAPTPLGKGKRNTLAEEDDVENHDVAVDSNEVDKTDPGSAAVSEDQDPVGAASTPATSSLARRLSTAESRRPETADAAGAVAAAEVAQLESLVSMGDGKHNSFTCHCWGLDATLWAANELGQLVRTV